MPPLNMLMVDDDQSTLNSLTRLFGARGFNTVAASSRAQAEHELNGCNPDLALLDIHLPDGTGLQLLELLRSRAPACRSIMMTAFADLDTAISAIRLGATDYIIKPFEVEQVLRAVDRILASRQPSDPQSDRETGGRFDFSRIVTRSPRFIAILESLKKVCPTDTTVLVTGESGTGKEMVARAVHGNSRRAARPLVAVNCAAIPSGLMEAELFGHVRGAFTGAVVDRKGYFESAGGGTLFLDEIGEISVDLQVKLLRALQERQISRVGDGRLVAVDFRLIVATQRNLTDDVKAGRFRQDLFYRLNVFPVELPPLRERPEDVEALAAHLLRELNRPDLSLSAEALEILQRHPWPGNVRELANVIERAALMAEGQLIRACDLPPELLGGTDGIRVEIPAESRDYRAVVKEVSDRARREMIVRALADYQGNVTRSALALGISRRQFINLMRELKIQRPAGVEEEVD